MKHCKHFFVLECGEMVCKMCGEVHTEKLIEPTTPEKAFFKDGINDYNVNIELIWQGEDLAKARFVNKNGETEN